MRPDLVYLVSVLFDVSQISLELASSLAAGICELVGPAVYPTLQILGPFSDLPMQAFDKGFAKWPKKTIEITAVCSAKPRDAVADGYGDVVAPVHADFLQEPIDRLRCAAHQLRGRRLGSLRGLRCYCLDGTDRGLDRRARCLQPVNDAARFFDHPSDLGGARPDNELLNKVADEVRDGEGHSEQGGRPEGRQDDGRVENPPEEFTRTSANSVAVFDEGPNGFTRFAFARTAFTMSTTIVSRMDGSARIIPMIFGSC